MFKRSLADAISAEVQLFSNNQFFSYLQLQMVWFEHNKCR